jgi:polyhydroxyalkanoate synthesis regulator phasin
MIFHGFIHSERDDGTAGAGVFRSNVLQFVNDTETHPIVKYKAFIVAGILVMSGLVILLLFNGERIFEHSYWRHLFIPLSDVRDKFGGDYRDMKMSDAAIFREAVEGMTPKPKPKPKPKNTKDGKVSTESGKFVAADTEAPERIKKTPCATECGQYIDLKGKINDLAKYVDAVKDQKDEIKQTADKIDALGKQIQDLNKSLSPGGQLNITL